MESHDLAYFDNSGSLKRPTEAINGVIETGRRIAAAFGTSFTTFSDAYSLSVATDPTGVTSSAMPK